MPGRYDMKDIDRLTGKDLGLKTVQGKLLTTKEIAKFLRVSERWVQMHMSNGTFPVRWYLIGERNHVTDSADLDDWLSKIMIEAGTAPLPLKAIQKIIKRR
jgi:predicted DNA-binding transcriptional regulator AlpA